MDCLIKKFVARTASAFLIRHFSSPAPGCDVFSHVIFQANPRWAVFGGCCLACLGAAVNAYYLVQLGTSVSHLTGDVAKMAMNIVEGRLQISGAVLSLLAATAGFVLGATAAGYAIHHPTMELSRPYGRAVMAIGVCLGTAHFTFLPVPILSIGLAAAACGFQNALATHYRGMVLRTTHLTGLLTDFGTNLGMLLKGHQMARWRLLTPALLVLSFFLGALSGCVLAISQPRYALLLLATCYLLGGLAWAWFQHHWHAKHPG